MVKEDLGGLDTHVLPECLTPLTSTVLNHCRTDRKDCLDVRSYITMTPSAFRKNCWVMHRYLWSRVKSRC